MSIRSFVPCASFTPFTARRMVRPAAEFIAWGVLLGLAYGQSPLYTSNQNQYFLHGLAQAGRGLLAEDWLANTSDPTPVFTWLVASTARYLSPAIFYLYYSLLFAVYLYSIRRIAEYLHDFAHRESATWVFLALIFVAHSAGLRVLLGQGIGGEWRYLFDGGLAGQRLLGTVFQPSSFGVFLLLSIQQFLDRHPYRAVIAAAIAATVHPTYLLGAAVLTVSYAISSFRGSRNLRQPLQIAGLGLVLVIPILSYSYSAFYPSSGEAQEILVNFRIPAHAVVSGWFGVATIASLSLIGAAFYLARRSTQLFTVIVVSVLAGLGLTLVQIVTDSAALALIFPWRLSTYLVPLSVAIIASWLAMWSSARVAKRWLASASAFAIALSVLSGLAWMAVQRVQRDRTPARSVLAYVGATVAPGELYAVPDKMQDFRLATGAPVLADFKSIPYRSGEVLNWFERVRLLQWFYRAEIDCGLLGDFDEYGVTHLVFGPDQAGQTCAGLEQHYFDGRYAVYTLELP